MNAAGDHIVRELADAGRRAVFLGADLAVPDDIARLAAEARKTFGQIHVLVNNAGIYPPQRVGQDAVYPKR
jgi:NAD(P)-dependent dehydrogenase (short-subunit alcohol dehydrogenase family)